MVSHAKGSEYKEAAPAIQLRALAAHSPCMLYRAAFIVGLLGLTLNTRNLLFEVREISRMDTDE